MCLLVSLALVTLAAISSRHMLLQQQQHYGSALAHQIATRISAALETGDLLSVAAALQRFLEATSAEEVALFLRRYGIRFSRAKGGAPRDRGPGVFP